MSLLVAGWVAIDEIETPFSTVSGLLGGSATCAAVAGALFTDVRLLAAIGEDFPERELAKLHRPGIDLTGVTVTGPQSSRWGGRYHFDMNTRDTVYTEIGVNADWRPALPAGWDDSRTVFLAALAPGLQRELIRSVMDARSTMVDTIRYFIDTDLEGFRATMAVADFVALNDGEAREIAGLPSVARAGRALLAEGPSGVLVKLGEYGAALITDDDYFVAPGYPLDDVVDPTGAGDAFAGGFMGYLDTLDAVTPPEIRRAVVYGSAVASFCVEGFGPSRLLSLTRAEVDARYREFRKLTYFEAAD